MGELVYERKLSKYVTLDGGVRAFRQIFHDIGLETTTATTGNGTTITARGYSAELIEYVGFVGLSWQSKPAKF